MKRNILFIVAMMLFAATGVQAQKNRQFLTPDLKWGGALSFDMNSKVGTGGFALTATVGGPCDYVNFSAGVGYRGFFDLNPPLEFVRHSSFSDWLLYDRNNSNYGSHIRPMGGQIVIPMEMKLNVVTLDDDEMAFYLGCGVELGYRLYQSQRYENFYGAHTMNASSLCFCPQIGFTTEELDISLYWRQYTNRALNGGELDTSKFTRKFFIGLQFQLHL